MHQCFCYFVNEKQCTAQPFPLPIEMFYEVFRLSKVAYTTENKNRRGVLYQNAASRFEKKRLWTLESCREEARRTIVVVVVVVVVVVKGGGSLLHCTLHCRCPFRSLSRDLGRYFSR